MLEKPILKDEKIVSCFENEYGLKVKKVVFLPLGADLNTAVYRVVTNDETVYFLKLRRGKFNKASVTIPKYLNESGIQQIIPSLKTRTGKLWANLKPFKAILYPFIEGQHAFEKNLSQQQLIEFGAALKKFHETNIPATITREIAQEKFSPKWRNKVRAFLHLIDEKTFDEPVARELATFLKTKSDETLELVKRVEQLTQILQQQAHEYVLCHADIHGWNLLIDVHGALYMVDWDTLLFAPKERDLMFIGVGLAGGGYTPHEEEALFYQGYGPTDINQTAIAYYRYERIIEDIAVSCEQLLLSNNGGEDRKQSLEYLKSNFLPDGTIKSAYLADKTLSDPAYKPTPKRSFPMTHPQPEGFLATPANGTGPGVLVLHAWWGLNDTFKAVCTQLAEAGFVAFAPDLYHGKVTDNIVEAEALVQALDANHLQAAAEIAEATEFLAEKTGGPLGVIGFSMGAFYALMLAAADPEHIRSVVLFYGSGSGDFSSSKAEYLCHFAQNDEYEPPSNFEYLAEALKNAGRPFTFHHYPGTGHWFFEPDRPDAYNPAAAALAWERTLAFLKR